MRTSRAEWTAWARTHKLLAVLIPAVAVILAGGIAAAAIGGGSGSGTATAASGSWTGGGTTGSSGPSALGGTRTGTSTSVHAEPPLPPVTRGSKWLAGPVSKLLGALNTDLGKISSYQRTGKQSAAKSAGTALAGDASAALDGPMPPVEVEIYRSALHDFQQIGTYTASGNFRKANSLLAPATLGLVRVTAAADPSAPVNSPAQVTG